MLLDYKLKNEHCLAIGTDELILFDKKEEMLLWRVEFDNIRTIEVVNLCTLRIAVEERAWEGLSLGNEVH